MNSERIRMIKTCLQEVLDPEKLEVIDESHLHIGHPGAATGLGHFRVHISSRKFTGLTPIQRHRLVYDALGPMMQTDIHALSLTLETPSQGDAQSVPRKP